MEMDSLLDRVVKKEDEFDQSKTTMLLEDYVVENNNDLNHSNNKSVSIAERRAAKCGFNASNINDAPFRTTGLPAAASPSIRSPYFFTVPPGLSPSALLDSPIMLPNSQAQLSPTTGTFQFPSLNHDNLKLKLKLATNGGDNSVDTECSSTFNPHQGFTHSISENLRVENEPFDEYKYTSDFQEMAKKDCYEGLEENKSSCLQQPSNISTAIATNQTFNHNNHHTVKERITHQNPEKRQKVASSIPKDMAKYSEDGYYWRKYGQKQVKGSEYPRSYFKCTNTNCLVKKKVERSHDGQITEIVYKGSHNHPKSQPAKGGGSCVRPEGGNKDIVFGSDWRNNGVDNGTSSMPFMGDFSDPSLKDQFEPVQDQTQELSSTFGSQDGEDQNGASPDSISFNEDDEENGECEPKRRKRDTPNETTISRSTREPRVVVQIESNIDILDDGYRWRKYGQKVVKGNPNPRSYYKCTTPGCPVRKHVERAANDIKSVVTTYEGKHNHEVPSSKNGTLVISDAANLPSTAMNNTLSTSSTMAHKSDIPRSGKQAQDLPLYMERKPPLLNYNEMMRSSNLPGNFPGADLNFGTSSIYPLSFPPFPSIPYNPLLLNGNHHHHHHHMKTFPSSNLYPMLPDYMTLPTPMNQTGVHVPLGGNFQVNNYQAFQPSIPGQEMKVVDCQAKGLRPKEEQRDDGDIYSSCLSIQNHGNRAM